MFEKLLPSYQEQLGLRDMKVADFDWALHPGGEAIIEAIQKDMCLTDEQVRASKEIYKTRGNSSSPTVLIVLDKLRTMGRGRDHIVATSFGPGISIEMSMLRRWRSPEDED